MPRVGWLARANARPKEHGPTPHILYAYVIPCMWDPRCIQHRLYHRHTWVCHSCHGASRRAGLEGKHPCYRGAIFVCDPLGHLAAQLSDGVHQSQPISTACQAVRSYRRTRQCRAALSTQVAFSTAAVVRSSMTPIHPYKTCGMRRTIPYSAEEP